MTGTDGLAQTSYLVKTSYICTQIINKCPQQATWFNRTQKCSCDANELIHPHLQVIMCMIPCFAEIINYVLLHPTKSLSANAEIDLFFMHFCPGR